MARCIPSANMPGPMWDSVSMGDGLSWSALFFERVDFKLELRDSLELNIKVAAHVIQIFMVFKKGFATVP